MDFLWRSARNCSLSDDSIKSRPVRQEMGNFSSTATCRPFTGDATTRNALSFHSVECLLEKLQVRSVSCFLASGLDPFFLESILRRPIILIKDAEDAGERKSTRLNSSHVSISYAVFCLKKKKYSAYKSQKMRNND